MKLLFFGDSICVGQRVSPHLTWVTRVSEALCDQNGDLSVVNNSVNGNTTRMALERVQSDLQSEAAHIVYIQFGLNDANYWVSDNGHPRVSLRGYEANLLEIASRARLAGATKVLIANNHLTQLGGPVEQKVSPNAPMSYRDNLMRYNSACKEIAVQAEAEFIDVGSAWMAGPESDGGSGDYLHSDGLHLSRKGHDFYFELLWPLFRAQLSS